MDIGLEKNKIYQCRYQEEYCDIAKKRLNKLKKDNWIIG